MSISGPTIFLLILLGVGLIGKNQAVIFAVCFLLFLRWTGLGHKSFPFLDHYGIHIGVTAITIAVLVPIATGDISLQDLWNSMKSTSGIVALIAGIIVAILGGFGIGLLDQDPQVTTALILGTIIAVAVFKGVAVGPIIGAGIAYMVMKAIELFN